MVTVAPEVNIDDWLDPQSDNFNPTLAHAVFHYSARTQKGERSEAAIATDEMNSLLGINVDGVIPTTNHLESWFMPLFSRSYHPYLKNAGLASSKTGNSDVEATQATFRRRCPIGPDSPPVPKIANLKVDLDRDARAHELLSNRLFEFPQTHVVQEPSCNAKYGGAR
ncbi:hypothetical protein R3P38DRAFT_3222366 [Favolaschia claudopus]|uniref:Uncharacterized protein n=1 Tax=Favolaschia claudopus TaxID=2862362 RepID=A0AAV9ZZX4_9AGAR